MGEFLAVFIGGGVGSVLRYGISRSFSSSQGDFPTATFIANLLAAAVLGLAWQYFSQKLGLSPVYRTLVMTGFCGGLSTFSTFSLETLRLTQQGNWGMALLYVVLSVVASVGMVWLASRLPWDWGWVK